MAFLPTLFFVGAEECRDISNLSDYSDAELKKIFDACSFEIESTKQVLKKKEAQTSSIQRNLSILEAQIRKQKAQIRARSIEIYRLKNKISSQAEQIKELEKNIDSSKLSLKNLLRSKIFNDDYSYIEIFFAHPTLSDFFDDTTNKNMIEEKISEHLETFQKLKKEAEEKKNEFAERTARERELISKKKQEVVLVNSKKLEHSILLAQSKKEEAKYKKLISEKETIKAKIRNRIFRVASGEKISFGDALALIEPYESALGIDSAFLLAVLFQESGHKGKIGGNIGRCYYNQSNRHGSSKGGYQVMSKSQQPAFLQIMSGIGKDPASVKVSCPIPSDGSYGGAMGPAQFMPKTWLAIRGAAAKILGKSSSNLSPFSNQDAFIASGAYLRDLYYSKSCTNYANKYSHISPKKILRERCAAAKYYAGGAWWKYRMKYGESVVRRANRFRADIATLHN